MNDSDKMRVEFEKWADRQCLSLTRIKRDNGTVSDYAYTATFEAWQVWQAAYACCYAVEDQTMKVFIWCDVDTMSGNYHSNGGVVAFAETEERAREIANVNGCAIKLEEKPDEVRDITGGDEKVFYMPNAGCC